ncbi:DUF1501 domain-containing protein [Zavarzinella formosa]|uniref:DUF1501 domain-containing protein n=1 Tax=Zavarzinella formosa TaxID=360055 RepID=UPI0004963090|nr:DUF1501 domain-containing protein [Zavarzinella formosa]
MQCASPVSRRDMLAACGAGFGMIGLAGMLGAEAPASGALAPKTPHFPAKAKHIIHVYMNGGPSQVDTFDPKPALAKHAGQRPASITGLKTENGTLGLKPSPFKFTKHGQSGLEISEIYPHVAQHADELCVIRSMYTDIPNHEPSMFMMNSGHLQALRPSYGSWMVYGLGTENQNLPGYIVLSPGLPVNGAANWSSRFLPGIYQGCHINLPVGYDPRTVLPFLQNQHLGRDSQRRQLDFTQRLNTLHADQRNHDPLLDARIASMEMAFRMQTAAQEAFDLNQESNRTREMYGINGKGGDVFASNCLLARRLVERGVRAVQIYTGTGQPWDTHSNNDAQHRQLALGTDQAIGGLLGDLKQRGLLDETIVLWGGEFGRTPASQGGDGRDHNHWGFSLWVAGGGFRGGMAYGATDEFGYRAEEKRTHVHDLHATILHLMGLDHEKLTYRYSGRDHRLTDVSGVVMKDILA